MSVRLTEQAVVERRKTQTRRLGWRFLKRGDRLTLCRKVQGRRPGEPLVRLAEVEVIDVGRQRLSAISDEDVVAEGLLGGADGPFAEWDTETGYPTTAAWVEWFCEEMNVGPDDEVTRIEWRYRP